MVSIEQVSTLPNADSYGSNYPFLRRKITICQNPSLRDRLESLYRSFGEIYFPLHLKNGQTLLDVGCCIGDLGKILHLGGVKTYGIDLNHTALTEGKKLGGNDLAVQATADHLPFADHRFDAVVSQDLLEHLPNEDHVAGVVKEMGRVLGGTRMVHKITVLEDRGWIDEDSTHHIKQPADWWKSYFNDLGWQVIAPTTRIYAVGTRRKIPVGFHRMHGYFLIEKRA